MSQLPHYLFRITKTQYAGKLQGSGYAARWNPNGVFMSYTAQSKALACLEMLVHLQSDQFNHLFKITEIILPAKISCLELPLQDLSQNWTDILEIHKTQDLGKKWIISNASCLLKVPSALIKGEFNYLINPAHPDFNKIKDFMIEDFLFDERLVKLN